MTILWLTVTLEKVFINLIPHFRQQSQIVVQFIHSFILSRSFPSGSRQRLNWGRLRLNYHTLQETKLKSVDDLQQSFSKQTIRIRAHKIVMEHVIRRSSLPSPQSTSRKLDYPLKSRRDLCHISLCKDGICRTPDIEAFLEEI